LTVSVLNFLVTFFWQLFSLALVSLTIHVTHFLLPMGMQKRPSVSARSIFQSNLRITAHNSLSYLLAGIRRNLRIATHTFLSCPPIGIRRNLHITAHTSLSCSPAGICHTLLLKSSNVLLLGKTVLTNAQVLQRGLLFLFVHWLMRVVVLKGGK
jgi:hypothetical protein